MVDLPTYSTSSDIYLSSMLIAIEVPPTNERNIERENKQIHHTIIKALKLIL